MNHMPLIQHESFPVHVIDWIQPSLPRAVDWLIERHRTGENDPKATMDLSDNIWVLPTTRSVTRVRELLVDRCQQEGVPLIFPDVITVGSLPEKLYQPQRPFAGEFVQRLAWVTALKGLGQERLSSLTAQSLPADSLTDWMPLAGHIQRLHRELASHLFTFKDVLRMASEMKEFNDHARWEALYDLQQSYFREMASAGMWDMQSARRLAVEHDECKTDRHIVLIGTVDLDVCTRRMLRQVEDQVATIIFCDPDKQRWFDRFGALDLEYWSNQHGDGARPEIPDEKLRVANRPADQAFLAAQYIANAKGRYRADEISIGIPDERLTPFVEQALDRCGLQSSNNSGAKVTESSPFRLIRLLARWLETGRFSDFLRLTRHPDLHDHISNHLGSDQWVLRLERYRLERLPLYLRPGARQVSESVRDVHRLLADAVQPLIDHERLPLDQWCTRWMDAGHRLMAERPLDRARREDRRWLAGYRHWVEALQTVADAPAGWNPQVTVSEAIELIEGLIGDARLAVEKTDVSIDLLGWLELPLDDSSLSIITGFK